MPLFKKSKRYICKTIYILLFFKFGKTIYITTM